MRPLGQLFKDKWYISNYITKEIQLMVNDEILRWKELKNWSQRMDAPLNVWPLDI